MFVHLLIPLDGTRMAESAIPAAASIAGKCGSRLTLLHIIERDAPERIHGERHLTDAGEAAAYLQSLMDRVSPPGAGVGVHVHETEEGNVARSLVEHARELGVDLIVMCTHGHKRLDQVLFGTIAQQVIALGETPVLTLHPELPLPGPPAGWRSALIPLDGDPSHEESIPVASELGRICDFSLHLLVSIPTYGSLSGTQATRSRFAPAATSELLEMAEEEASEYLKRQINRLRTQGREVDGEVARGDPASVIAEAASRLKVDLIVMGTHGRVGASAFWTGSVAPAVFNRSRLPLLLVPLERREPPHA